MPAVPSPDGISPALFAETLARYGPFVEALSAAKGLKQGQKSLAALDRFRYVQAPKQFNLAGPEKKNMQLSDIKDLVEWKLRHGKFRPSLMGLVSGNPAVLVATTVQTAVAAYSSTSEGAQAAALEALKKLKGIGPATASLLLSVHDSDKVLFFSDEAYYWLCGRGRKVSLKYTQREYEELVVAAGKLMKRLDVGALDVERVAYVLMKESEQALTKESVLGKTASKHTEKPAGADAAKKRKAPIEDTEKHGLRRSKRGKAT